MNDMYIFILYCHEDEEAVDEYIEMLSKNYSLWIDDGQSTDELTAEVTNAIEQCACFIAFTSRNFDASGYCSTVLSYAQDHLKNIPIEDICLEEKNAMEEVMRLCEGRIIPRKRRGLPSPPTTLGLEEEEAYDLAMLFYDLTIEDCPKNPHFCIRMIKRLFYLFPTEDIADMYMDALSNLLLDAPVEVKTWCHKEIQEAYNTLPVETTINTLAESLYSLIGDVSMDDSIKYLGELRNLYNKFPNETTGSALALALYVLSFSRPYKDGIGHVNEIKEIYDKFHTEEIAEHYANGLVSLVLSDDAPNDDKEKYVCQIREILGEFPTKDIAYTLAGALAEIAEYSPLEDKYRYCDEIKDLFQVYHNDEIRNFLSRVLYYIGFEDKSNIDKAKEYTKQIKALHEETQSSLTEVILATALFNLANRSSLENRYPYVQQIRELYNHSQAKETAVIFAQALFTITVDNEFAGINDCANELRELYAKHHMGIIALQLAKVLLNLCGHADLSGIEACITEIRSLYHEYPVDEIGECLAKGLFNQSLSSTQSVEDNIKELRELYREIPTSSIAFQLAKVMYSHVLNNPEQHQIIAGYVDELTQIHNAYHQKGVGFFLANMLFLLFKDNSVKVKEDYAKRIDALYAEHTEESIARFYVLALYELIDDTNLSHAKRLIYVKKLKEIYEKYQTADMADMYANALCNPLVSNDVSASNKTFKQLKKLYQKHHTQYIASELAKGLLNTTATKNFTKKDLEEYANEMKKLYTEYPTTEIGEYLAFTLSLYARDNSLDVIDTCVQQIKKIHNAHDTEPTAYSLSYALCAIAENEHATKEMTMDVIKEITALHTEFHTERIATQLMQTWLDYADKDNTVKSNLDCCRKIKKIHDEFHSEETAYGLALACQCLTFLKDVPLIYLTRTIDHTKKAFEEFHTKRVGEQLATALGNFALDERNNDRQVMALIDQLKDIHEEFHCDITACSLAMGWLGLCIENNLSVKYTCLNEIKRIYKQYHVQEVALVLAKSYYSLTFNNAPTEINKCNQAIHHLEDEFPDIAIDMLELMLNSFSS